MERLQVEVNAKQDCARLTRRWEHLDATAHLGEGQSTTEQALKETKDRQTNDQVSLVKKEKGKYKKKTHRAVWEIRCKVFCFFFISKESHT